MVQLKHIALRLKSITNIKKITRTMKMVSASKFTKAERELSAARPFGYGPRKFYQSSQLVKGEVDAEDNGTQIRNNMVEVPKGKVKPLELVYKSDDEESKVKKIYVAVTSDRGLCGGVHTCIARRIRQALRDAGPQGNKLVCIGDKARTMLHRSFPQSMLISIKDIGRIAPVFSDAALIATAITEAGYLYELGQIFYNKYQSPVKYELSAIPFFNKNRIQTAPNMQVFDEIEQDELECYIEWTLAALLYYAVKESAAAEQSSRVAAMDNATKNADDMIRHLTLIFNRTRQAVITRELTEIIAGAAVLNDV